ncbi:MAG: hypothetical protein ACYSO3_00250 [Planctomycetota bacterium]|jgi:hypothetical protein
MGQELSLKHISKISLIVYLVLLILSLFLMSMPGGFLPWYCIMGFFALPPIVLGPRFYRILGIVALILAILLCIIDYQAGKVWRAESKAKYLFDEIEEQWDISNQKWTRCKIPFPLEDTQLFLSIRASHPFLAEFERKIILGDSSSDDVDIPIIPDTGGQTRLKVFWFSDNDRAYLKLSGIQGDWCVINVLAKKLVFSSIILTDDILLFDSDRKKGAKSYDDVDWQYIGMVKYDKPDYEKNLIFKPNGGSPWDDG